MKKLSAFCVLLFTSACNPVTQETIFGVKLGLNCEEQIKISHSNGLNNSNEYFPISGVVGNLDFECALTKDENLILSSINVNFNDVNYKLTEDDYSKVGGYSHFISLTQKEELFNSFIKKYGKYNFESNVSSDDKYLMNTFYFWNIDDLKITLNVKNYRHNLSFYEMEVHYRFSSEISTKIHEESVEAFRKKELREAEENKNF